jgi:hypothetical protein
LKDSFLLLNDITPSIVNFIGENKEQSVQTFKMNYNRIKEYRLKNKELLLEKNKEWRKNNPNYDKLWKEKNKEKVKESKKKTYEKHKDIINLNKKEYREKNRERLLELGKEYREKNREELNRKRREKRELNKELARENERKRFKENPHLKLIANYRCRVKNYLKYNKSSENTHTIHIVGLSPIELKEYIEVENLNENEKKLGYALIDLFDNYETIFSGADNNKFNKNVILLSLREMTNLSTKEIRSSIKRFKKLYVVIQAKIKN